MAAVADPTTFRIILIKPSHYDDDGYVIQWARSSVPSNTMAAVYGLATDCADRRVLGPDVRIVISSYDETNTRIRPERIARALQAAGERGVVLMVGVQSNQFPRAVDLAARFRALGLPVVIGGFHTSGCVAMLPTLPDDLVQAMQRGIALYAGELEGRFDALLLDAFHGRLQMLYDFMKDLPELESTPVPYLPAEQIRRMSGARTSFDAGRGCPFLCSFCTIINVQGRKSRHRSPDDVERIIRANLAQGIHKFFVTDDNFARNRAWEALFDRMIALREDEGLAFTLTIQVDTRCHTIPRFIEKAGRAGVDRVFIGLENINPDSLAGTQKKQNDITQYRAMLQAWHGVGALTLAGYILGFPTDTPESILRDIKIIQRELPVDLLEFFILTPLPGSQDHKEMVARGVELEPDMNAYDSAHVTAPHARMSKEEWAGVYRQAWDAYYTPEHVETVIRRAAQWGFDTNKIKWMMLTFHATATIEGVHPLDSGLFRRKYLDDRRPSWPREGRIGFYARYALEIVTKHWLLVRLYLRYEAARRRALAAGSSAALRDRATEPVAAAELVSDDLELFTATAAARAAVDRVRERAERRGAAALSLLASTVGIL
jgi:pyruvate-formate lyase-activating enzyme